jgi:hypothetical protein
MTFLGIKQAAADYLHDLEDLTKPSNWAKLTEKTISVIVKGCRDKNIHISATAINKMMLLNFLCMHHERIQRPLLDLTCVDEDMLDDIERQKKHEDHYKDDKPTSDPPSLTLDDVNITKSINTFEEDLKRRRGITGIPLPYTIRHDPNVTPAHLEPPFGEDGSPYVSMDDEMIGRGQVFSRDVDCDEDDGPFSKVFLIDAATVFTLMEKAFGKTNWWTNARQFSKKKEGRKAWRSLIKFHFGNDRVLTMAEALRTKLQNSNFSGPRRNFDFTKYCNLHTSAHTTADDLVMHQEDKTPIFSETTKIQFFQAGITDPYFATIKGIVNSSRYKFRTFESVKDAYVNFMRTSPRPELAGPARDTRSISQTSTKRDNRSNQTGPNKTKDGPKKLSQADIDACTHITLKQYTRAEYDKFTAAEKAKHYQLKKASGFFDNKRTAAEVSTGDDGNEAESVTNANNSALVRQSKIPKSEK